MEQLERLRNTPVTDHSTAFHNIGAAHPCSGKKLDGSSCSRIKEPFITTSHSKYHLHYLIMILQNGQLRQIVELETTVKKSPYELRAFQTPSLEPILQNKKHK